VSRKNLSHCQALQGRLRHPAHQPERKHSAFPQVRTPKSAPISRRIRSFARLFSSSKAHFPKCADHPYHFNLLPRPKHQRNFNCAPSTSQIFPERRLQSASRLTGLGGSGINSALQSQQQSPSEESEIRPYAPPPNVPDHRPRAHDARLETAMLSLGSVHPVC
jgi:hypothetical protein